MIIDIRDNGTTVVTFEGVEEHQAVIAGLDDDRNHPARSALYTGLQRGRAAHTQRRQSVYAFAENVSTEAFRRGQHITGITDRAAAALREPGIPSTIAPPPQPITDESTYDQHQDCDWSWIGPGSDDEHAVCVAHRVRFTLPAEGFTALPVDAFDAMSQAGRGVSW